MVETQYDAKVKQIRTDNGTEFRSSEILKHCNERGIMMQTSCVYTPQQNGVVERKHRHIIEMARTLRIHANLPRDFWGECVLTVVHIINRLPTKATYNKIPYEVLTKTKVNYGHLRVFGCLAYAHDPTNTDKFEVRGRKCVFIGYPSGQKGYRVFDIEKRKVLISRDVTFYEEQFPFREIDQAVSVQVLKGVDQKLQSVWEEESIGADLVNSEDLSTEEISPTIQWTENVSQDHHAAHGREVVNTGARRSQRSREPPKHLSNYQVELPPSLMQHEDTPQMHGTTAHPIGNFVSNDRFSPEHKAFLMTVDKIKEPKSYKEAVRHEHWREAMRKEVEALEQNGTWTLEEAPPRKNIIDSKWVFKVKYKPTGDLDKFKARLVARGFTQEEGIDYHETFAPVAKLVTVRTLLAVAAKKGWIVHQLDVNNAFLHGDLHEEVYMKVPEGFAQKGDTRVCRLRKSLYGLKQASRNWYEKFTESLKHMDFVQSRADHSLFIYRKESTFIVALIYVDDVIIAGTHMEKIDEVKSYLDRKFSIKNLGPLKYFLRIEVARSTKGIMLNQRKYVLDLLKQVGMEGCRPSEFPMEQNAKLVIHDDDEDKDCDDNKDVEETSYRKLIGKLMYLTVTRPDIVYAVNTLSQYCSAPKQMHMNAVERILRYLKGTPGQGILLRSDGPLELEAFCDADWARSPLDRRSCTGFLVKLGGSPISWRTKKQSVVSRSSAESEYRAMANTVSELIWIRWLTEELGATQRKGTVLYCDNQAALHITRNLVFHERTKHVDIDCYFIRERVQSGEVKPTKIWTKEQLADIFTKALGKDDFQYLRSKLGIVNLHAPT